MTFTKTPLALVAASVLALTGCETINDPSNPNRQAQQGALLGAGAGALAGIVTGDTPEQRRRGAVVGAALGGLGGAAVGSLLDRQEAELRQQLGANTNIVNTGEHLVVTLPQDILFATDSATLTGALRSDLTTLAASLNRYPNSTVNVIGHTDNTGAASYNQDLSERRARAVSTVLVNAGVAPARIRTIGRGEDQPIASNLTPQGRAQNRRVEIIITPN